MKQALTHPVLTEEVVASLKSLLQQYNALQCCHDILERASSAQEMLKASDAKLADITAKLQFSEQAFREKEQVFESRMAAKRADLTAQIKTLQDELDRKQKDVTGWKDKAGQEVAAHERLIAEMQQRLASVQSDYRQATTNLDEARARHASFVKSLTGVA